MDQTVGVDEGNRLVQLAKVERRITLVEAPTPVVQQIQEVAPLDQLPDDHNMLIVRHKVQELHHVPAPHTHRVIDLALDWAGETSGETISEQLAVLRVDEEVGHQ